MTRDEMKGEWRTSATLFLVSLLVYLSAGVTTVTDSKYTLLLSEQLLVNRSFELDAYFWPNYDSSNYPQAHPDTKWPRHVKQHRGHLYYIYPHGTSILSVPFVLTSRMLGISTITPDGGYNYQSELKLQKVIAGFLMAIVCVIVFKTSRILLETLPSVLVTIAAGFGTQIFSIASRGLWSHTWGVLILSLICFLLLRSEKNQKFNPILLATLFSWGFFVRPTAAIYIVPLTIFIFLRFRSRCLPFIFTGLFWAALFLLYSYIHFGGLPDYYMRATYVWSLSGFYEAFQAQMISPSRGLLVYTPTVLIVGYLLAAGYPHIKYMLLTRFAILIVILHGVVMALQRNWWAGYSFGARLYTDIVPVFVLLAVIGVHAIYFNGQRARSDEGTTRILRLAGVCFVPILLVAAIGINAVGAISPSASRWNVVPYSIDNHPARALDWKNAQFLCALMPARFCPASTDAEINREFSLIDRNGDSLISKKEYHRSQFRMFDSVDKNHDSRVSLVEWRQIYTDKD